ncbi:DUF402 domain-containing protein [Streptomyces sp. NPDC058401]|uniref:DUF402 domain-containing protein n=1 Tax=Streptomyces sp. NPDC058401 TaxID=3346480 RepID=UPI0036579DCA
MVRQFTVNETIVRREILDGREWILYPMRVASDDGNTLAAYLHQGTPLTFGRGDFRWGVHPWAAFDPVWQSEGVLQLQRALDGYSVWGRWEDGRFAGWYVNFQAPMRRTERGFDTLDQELDLWIPGDGSQYRWKDVAEFEERERRGGFTPEEAAAVRAAAREVEAMVLRGDGWWEEWRNWQVPTEWTVPAAVGLQQPGTTRSPGSQRDSAKIVRR